MVSDNLECTCSIIQWTALQSSNQTQMIGGDRRGSMETSALFFFAGFTSHIIGTYLIIY